MAGDLQWSETGDRYMLKLFRDYVFHQVTPNGHPWVDLSHIIQCLNKVSVFRFAFFFRQAFLTKLACPFSSTRAPMTKYVSFRRTIKTS